MDGKNKKGLILLCLLLFPSVVAQQPQIPEKELADRVSNAVDSCLQYQDEQYLAISQRFDEERELIFQEVTSQIRWFKVSFALTFLGAIIIGFAVMQYIAFKLKRKKDEFLSVAKPNAVKSSKNSLERDSSDYEVFYGSSK